MSKKKQFPPISDAEDRVPPRLRHLFVTQDIPLSWKAAVPGGCVVETARRAVHFFRRARRARPTFFGGKISAILSVLCAFAFFSCGALGDRALPFSARLTTAGSER